MLDHIEPQSEEQVSLSAVGFGQSSTNSDLTTKLGEVSVLEIQDALSKTCGAFILALGMDQPSHSILEGSTFSSYPDARTPLDWRMTFLVPQISPLSKYS